MKLKRLLTAADSRICGGSTYGWNCYPNARYIDIADFDGEEIGACIFNTATNEVYEVEAHVYEDRVSYRWIDPAYAGLHNAEAVERNVDPNVAYDDVSYTSVDEDTILELVSKIVRKTYVHSQPEITDTGSTCKTDKPFREFLAQQAMGPVHADNQGDIGHFDDLGEFLKQQAMNAHTSTPCGGGCCHTGSLTDLLNGIPVPTGSLAQVDEDDDYESGDLSEYEVKLHITHRFSVKAASMEDAIEKAKSFNDKMKPSTSLPKGVCWEDHYVSKAEVSYTYAVEHIEE